MRESVAERNGRRAGRLFGRERQGPLFIVHDKTGDGSIYTKYMLFKLWRRGRRLSMNMTTTPSHAPHPRGCAFSRASKLMPVKNKLE